MVRELKYSLGIIVPLIVFVSLYFDGWMSYFVVVFAFGFIPTAELFLKGSTYNMPKEEEKKVKNERFFDWVLYLNVPFQFGLLFFFFWKITFFDLAAYEIIGKVFSIGMACGVLGINVAHELGHRHKKSEQNMSKALLLTSLYMHFFIEHNRGHHKNIATIHDPASSRRNESLYSFYFRSVIGGYMSAWHLENTRIRKTGVAVYSLKNEMIQFTIIQVLFLALIVSVFSWLTCVLFIVAAIIGFLMLETVNYIEHYGLQRKEIQDGVFEKTQPWHSWNSNHPLGRILLYELTRHSDHHFHAGRKYQVLRHFEEAPQMPTGYPGMMICAFFPPLWFSIMNKRIDNYQAAFNQQKIAA